MSSLTQTYEPFKRLHFGGPQLRFGPFECDCVVVFAPGHAVADEVQQRGVIVTEATIEIVDGGRLHTLAVQLFFDQPQLLLEGELPVLGIVRSDHKRMGRL